MLSEANLLEEGLQLGPVGAAIVAHTILGLLFADPRSHICTGGWKPGGGADLGFPTSKSAEALLRPIRAARGP